MWHVVGVETAGKARRGATEGSGKWHGSGMGVARKARGGVKEGSGKCRGRVVAAEGVVRR